MARGFRRWVEPNPVTGQPAARAARLTADAGRFDARDPWAQPDQDPDWPLGKPWALLLALLNLERRVPPPAWPGDGPLTGRWPAAGADLGDWTRFQRDSGAPYLLAEDQGHPLLWFPATDGEMWGFLFNFGLRPGQWHWWVPGTEHLERDPATGASRMILGETHTEAADGGTIRELLADAPPALFDVDAAQFLTLPEALDGELQRHSADERNRCRFFVYGASDQVHELSHPPEYGPQALEAHRKASSFPVSDPMCIVDMRSFAWVRDVALGLAPAPRRSSLVRRTTQ